MTPGRMDHRNKLNHIFANPNQNLDALVRHYGTEEEASRAIVDAVNQAHLDGNLSTDQLGLYKQVFDVGGYPVMVAGRIINGRVRIGTAWIPPHPWGWSAELAALRRTPRRLVQSVFLPPWKHGGNDA